MKSILVVLTLTLTAAMQTYSQGIDSLPKATIWYSADFYNDSLGCFIDLSGNLNHGFYSDTITDDTVLINYNKSLKIIGMSQGIQTNYKIKNSCELTMFCVFMAEANKDSYGLWKFQLDSTKMISMGTQKIVDLNSKTIQYTDTTINTSLINLFRRKYSNEIIDTSVSGFTLFESDSIPFSGRFAEFLFFDNPLCAEDINKTYTYLALKYGISLFEMNYVNSVGEVLWNFEENSDFDKDIAGIGKDTMLNTNQKQSNPSDGKSNLTISAGNLCDNNNNNITEINNADFLIWGDNGLNFSMSEPDTADFINMPYVSEKKWKMCRSGKTADEISTNLKVFAPGLMDSTILLLVINREGNFDFPLNTTEVIYPVDFDTLGNYYFNNIYWDTDSSGFDAFAFQNLSVSDLFDEDSNEYSNNNGNGNNQEQTSQNFVVGMDFANDPTNDQSNIINPESYQISENIDQNNLITEFITYPNPSYNTFTIAIKTTGISDVVITIADLSGKVIDKMKFSGSNYYFIDKNIVESGCYFIQVENAYSRKILRQIVY